MGKKWLYASIQCVCVVGPVNKTHSTSPESNRRQPKYLFCLYRQTKQMLFSYQFPLPIYHYLYAENVCILCGNSVRWVDIYAEPPPKKKKKNEKKRNSEAKIGWTSSSECIAWGMRQWIRYFYSAISSLKSITDKALAHWMGPCQHQDVWNHSSAENEKKTQLWAAKEKLLLLSKSNNFRKHCDKYRIVSRMNDWILCTFYRVSSH